MAFLERLTVEMPHAGPVPLEVQHYAADELAYAGPRGDATP